MIITFGISFFLLWLYILWVAKRSTKKIFNNKSILVLGKCLTNNKPDKDYRARLQRTTNITKHNFSKCIHILGGKTHRSETSEALAGKKYLINKGINHNIIKLEERSQNTLENLKHYRALYENDNQQVILITNRYHMARSLMMAKGVGINAIAYPAEDYFNYSVQKLINIFKESFHLHWYLTGKYWAKITNNERMLNRIS